MATDFIYPVGNPRIAPAFGSYGPNGYRISQMFDNSCDPALKQGYYYAGIYFCGHSGVDLSDMQEGGIVSAVAPGVVVFAGYLASYGEMVRIQHLLPDGTDIYSQYEHMMWGSLRVWTGEVVQMGQVIGLVGSTGFVTGAHLHFEMKAVNDDGPGYSFGNAALLIGYYEPISYVAEHTQQLLPTPTATPPPPTVVPITPLATVEAVSATVTVTATSTSAVTETTDGTGGEHQAVLSDFYKQYPSYVTVAVDHLNVRAGSDFVYAPLTSVRKGARLGYLGMSGNGWVHVALPSNVTGYVVRQWVAGGPLPALPPVVASGVPRPPLVTVLDTRYPARTGPMMHDAAMETLKQGEALSYLGTFGSWDKVVMPTGRIGWVLNWYLREPRMHKNLSVTAPTPAPTTEPAQTTDTTQTTSTAPTTSTQVSTTPKARVTSGAATTSYVITTVDGLHLRQGPRLGAPLLATLSQGVKLAVHGYATSWAAVTTPNHMQGYVLRFYIRAVRRPGTADSSTGTAAGASTTHPLGATRQAAGFRPPYLVVDVSSATFHAANLHAAPNLKARVVLSEPSGTRLAFLDRQGNWDQVETRQGAIAWIRQDLVRTP